MTTSWKGPEQVSLALTAAAFSQWENFKLFGLVGPLGKRESLGSGASPQAAVARPVHVCLVYLRKFELFWARYWKREAISCLS